MTDPSTGGARGALRIYVGLLGAALVALLVWSTTWEQSVDRHVLEWFLLTALYAASESMLVLFHHERGRQSLSASEAVLLPMIVGLSSVQVIWGVVAAMVIAHALSFRDGFLRHVFNISQYGLSAAAATVVWASLSDASAGFGPQDAAAAAVAALAFAALSHILVATAIALSEGIALAGVLKGVAAPTVWNLALNISLGLVFAASFAARSWTVLLFPLPLAALYLGYRAIVAQSAQRERVEHLHAASRALSSSPDLRDSIETFLSSVADMVSAAEARAVVNLDGELKWWSSRPGEGSSLDALSEEPMRRLMSAMEHHQGAMLVSEDDSGALRDLADALAIRSLIAVPLEDAVAGCLIAVDRVGADQFSDEDARLLEALGNELVVTLGSYRLFAQVAEERERFGRIFAGSTEGICLLDDRAVVRAWNPALEGMTGYLESDVLGKPWSNAVMIRDSDERRIEGSDLVRLEAGAEVELATREGPMRWISILSGPVHAADGGGWVVLMRDVTAQREAEGAKSDFIATISHELRTPLTAIKGALQVMDRPLHELSEETAAQLIAMSRRGTQRLERLVMNLLVMSQIESGTLTVSADRLALRDLVDEQVASVLHDHPRVEVKAPDAGPIVRADRERLGQVISHLLDNAAKFGGVEGQISISLHQEAGFALVSISDEGRGIPKADHTRIFERFVRLGQVLTRDTQGAGVGLFIAKRSVEAMGGAIAVDSVVGKGATFHVRIPLAQPMAIVPSASSG